MTNTANTLFAAAFFVVLSAGLLAFTIIPASLTLMA